MMTNVILDHPCKDTCSGWMQGYEKGKREVTPIDWERVFKIYRRWFRLYKAKWHLVSIVETDDMLKQIVERSMRGEL